MEGVRIMKIALVGRINGTKDSTHKNLSSLVMVMASTFLRRGHNVVFEEEILKNLADEDKIFASAIGLNLENISSLSFSEITREANICIVMGGDGTVLNAAKLLTDSRMSMPILGINLGKVGFITDVPHDFSPDSIISMLENEKYDIEKRTMLSLRLTEEHAHQGFYQSNDIVALNDVVISRSTGRVIEFNVNIDGERAYTARGDGLMVTTPTGSTAYALSGGGPIIHPSAHVIEILPIMAQSLSTRPLIVNDTSSISIELVSGDAEVYVDGNQFMDLKRGESVVVSRSKFQIEFIHPKLENLTYSYYKTLAEKLNWHYLPGTPK
jgi:NAD+ kinase